MKVGDTFVCAETGKTVTVAPDGCSFNYAMSSNGEYLSDEGVLIREKRRIAEGSVLFAYVSGTGKNITTWKGQPLLTVILIRYSPRAAFGNGQHSVTARDEHGRTWYGRGSGKGMCITMRRHKQ